MQQYKFDSEKITNLIKLVSEKIGHTGGLYGEASFNYDFYNNDKTLFDEIDSVLSSFEVIENSTEKDVYDVDMQDSELEREYMKLFLDIDIDVFGHGTTTEEIAKLILKEGLRCKAPEITHTACNLSNTRESIEQIKEWPHLDSKYIVLTGIKYGDVTPIWENIDGNEYDYKYSLPAEYILGYIDVDKDEFISNANYRSEHDYNYDREYDMRLGRSANIMTNEEDRELAEAYSRVINVLSSIERRDGIISSEMYGVVMQVMNYKIKTIRDNLNRFGIANESDYKSFLESRQKDSERIEIANSDDMDLLDWDTDDAGDVLDWDDEPESNDFKTILKHDIETSGINVGDVYQMAEIIEKDMQQDRGNVMNR